ncbi:hypothetical protein JL720_13156 [Aureococcus anophagefferens]|nr:hypothetical protein JL720_13156 [Aureococcus anophagefferens]
MQKSIEGLPAPAHGGAMGPKQEKKKRASYFGGSGKKAALLPALEERVLVSLALVYDLNARVKSSPWLYRDGGSKKAQMAVAVAIREGTIGAQLAGGKLDLDGDVPAVCAAVKQTLANHAPITGYGHYGAFLDAGGSADALRAACGSTLAPVMARALHELRVAAGRRGAGAHLRGVDLGAALDRAGVAGTNVERSKSWTADRPSLDGAAPVFAGAPELPSSATAPALSSAPPRRRRRWRRSSSGGSSGSLGLRSLKVSWAGAEDGPNDEDALRNAFAFAGAVHKAGISLKKHSGLVLFKDEQACARAAAEYDGPWVARRVADPVLDVQARTLKVTWPSFAPRPKDEDLQFVFKKFGPLIQCGVGLKKRSALVLFAKAPDAADAELLYRGPWSVTRLLAAEAPTAAASDGEAPPARRRSISALAAPGGPERTLKVKWNGDVERPSDMLRTVFGHYGAVLKCGIGKRSAALVQFADADAAAASAATPGLGARGSGSGDGSEPGTTDDDRTDDAPPPPPTAAEVRRRSLAVTQRGSVARGGDLDAALAGLDAAPVVAAAVAGGHATVLLASEEDAAKCAAELEGTEFGRAAGAAPTASAPRSARSDGEAATPVASPPPPPRDDLGSSAAFSAAAASVGTLSTADVAQLLACQAQTLGDEIRATIKELVGGGAAPAPRGAAARGRAGARGRRGSPPRERPRRRRAARDEFAALMESQTRIAVWKSTAGSGGPDQTSNLSSSVTSTSIWAYYERGAAFSDWKPAAGPRLGRGAYGGAYGGAPARRAYVSVGPEFNPTSPALREWWGNITSADRPVVLNISTSDRPVY